MEVNKLKAAKDSLNIAIELLKECKQDVRLLEVKRDDIDELIESKSIRPFNKLNKLNRNQEIVLDKLKELDDDFIISTICIIQYHRQFNIINLANVILNLSLMSIFYIIFPLVLIILLEKAEFFIGGMIVGTALSTLFLHQLPYNVSVFAILITVVITYYISVWKERFN